MGDGDMPDLESLKKAVVGDAANETIKSGTLVTTRGIGVVAVGLIGTFLLLDQLGDTGPWKGMSATGKLMFVVAAGAIWAVVAAADAIARGLATASAQPRVVALPAGLVATKTGGVDSPGWHVAAVEVAPLHTGDAERFLIVKGSAFEWVLAKDLKFP
jgi:hypothetical protein